MKNFQLFPKRYGYLPYVFLIYGILPLGYILTESGMKQLIGFLMWALFLVSYRQLYSTDNWHVFHRWLAIQLIIIFTLSLAYNLNCLFMGFFAANFISWYKDRKVFTWAMIAFGITLLVPWAFYLPSLSITSIFYLTPFIIVMVTTPFGMRSMYERMDLERKLDEANEQIKELVKREERMRIARDLHDTLGHTLSLLTLKSQLVAKLANKQPNRAREEAIEMERISRSALHQVRELVADMRAITVAEEVIEVEEILTVAEIKLIVEGDTKLADVPFLTQNILSMCIREAITNVVKHSGASICTITIEQIEGKIAIVVEDNGKGIGLNCQNGNGLKGMQERLSLLDGTLSLSESMGTILRIEVPQILKQHGEEVAL